MTPYLGLVLAYVVGSIPAAYIAGKVTRGIDLRQHGSGNLGATNVYRVLGAKTAIAVLLFDAAKGAVPALWFPQLFGVDRAGPHAVTVWAIAFGIAAIIGHVRPVFLLWKGGGKGVATFLGVLIPLLPIAAAVYAAIWLTLLLTVRISSIAGMTAAISAPVTAFLLHSSLLPLLLGFAVLVLWKHRENILRLRKGTEPRLGSKTSSTG